MPRKRRAVKTRRTELTEFQFWELLLGPGNDRGISDFESPFTRKAAWYENRDELMADPTPGMRPWGFWEYEAGGNHPEDQAAELRRLRLLSDEEKGLLSAMRALSGEGKRCRSRRERTEEVLLD
jgi:hypothetical protein